MSIQGKFAALLNIRNIRISHQLVDDLVAKYDAQPWFANVVKQRSSRWDLWKTSFWLASHLPANAIILETGCGIASNLFWFEEQGFYCLFGFDIDEKALRVGEDLKAVNKSNIQLWQDDGLNPKNWKRTTFDAIICLNWTHLLDDFELNPFLKLYSDHLTPNGYIVIDVIDTKYNLVQNNQYLSSDWGKPESERKRSEYRKRYSSEEVKTAARAAGLLVIKVISQKQTIPKSIYILKKQLK